jgi:hypothetical protein
MLGMETVAKRMADYFVGHHPTMPGSGKKAQALDAARRLEDSAHTFMMASVPRPGKTTALFDKITVVLRASRKLAGIELGGTEESGSYQLKPAISLQEEMGAQLTALAV